MRAFYLPLFAALAGCTTLAEPLAGPRQAEVELLVRQTDSQLRQLLLDLADPAAVPAFAQASAAVDAARVVVATDAVLSAADFGLAYQADRGALGVTLALCADGVNKMAGLDPQQALAFGRGRFAFTCLVPLGTFSLR